MKCQTIQAFAEIKLFKPINTTSYIECLNQLQRNYEEKFTNVNFDFKQSAFLMDNPVSGDRVIIQPERIVISIKSIIDLEENIIFIKEIYDQIYGILDLKNFLRIGIRFSVGEKYNDLQKIDSIIKRSFFNGHIDCLDDSIFNIAMRCSLDREKYKINLGINPMSERQIIIDATTGKEVGVEENINLAIDLDFYTGFEIQQREYTNDDVKFLFDSVFAEQGKILDKIQTIIGE